MIKWCNITDRADDAEAQRFELLDAQLKQAGLETEFTSLVTDEEAYPALLDEVRNTYSQIRFSGRIGLITLPLLVRLPSALLSLRACDALVCDNHAWWPRFFLAEGLNQTLASDAGTLDLSGSVLILGATSEARAVVSALSRIGFNKMILTDPSFEACSAFVEELRRAYFGVQFQAVDRTAVTQIPGVCSIAVNTLTAGADEQSLNELAYFNFLKPGGFWLDLSIFPLNAALQGEAKSVGAEMVSGARVIAVTDQLWAQAAFKKSIDVDAYTSSLSV